MRLVDRISERVRREFFPEDYAPAIQLLGHRRTKVDAPGETGPRMQAAALNLARGSLPKLERAIADARSDYRDILWWGEAPQFQHLRSVEYDPGEPTAGPVEEAFLDAIRVDPCDNTNRLVYADWLEERGDRRAGYLRVLCEWLACSPTVAQPLIDRERELRAGLGRGWLARIRGMPAQAKMEPGKS